MGGKKGSSGKGAGTEQVGFDPAVLAKNYSTMCKMLGIKQHESIVDVVNGDEAVDHLTVDSEIGPVGVQAIVESLLGRHESLKSGGYKLITTLRLWRANTGDEGARILADYIVERGKQEKLEETPTPPLVYLQLLDCNLAVQGCRYLSSVLQAGGYKGLLTLNLDYNDRIGSDGLRALTEGLCTNSSITRLSLAYCEIDSDGGRSVKSLLVGSALEELNLKGNHLEGKGLSAFAKSLGQNSKLRSLDISNNDIGKDEAALQSLADALETNKTLVELRMQENGIEEVGAKVLIDSGVFDKKTGNTTLKEFLVDVKLPMDMFEALLRVGAGGKKGGKKKGGKKKKK